MSNKAKTILIYFTLTVVSLFFLFWGLVKAKAFLAPLAVAALLAMVILPVARWMEKKGLKRAWASLFADLLILLFFVVLGWVVSFQVKGLVEDWPQMKKRIEPKISELQQTIEERTGISIQEQDQRLQNQIPGGASGASMQGQASASNQQEEEQMQGNSQPQQSGGSMLSSAGSFVGQLLGFLGTFLLVFVYIFFFLLYRNKFKKSVLKMVPDGKRDEAREIISQSADISQNYLFGRLILIIFLAVIYSAGLTISGVQQPILISILAAVLTLIPYIGNIIGYSLALGMALFSGSGLTGAIGVTVTFAVTQFVESYILEPYIVGDKVNINPIFTIIVVVLGNAVWGVVGMLIAIPTLGIAKVVFDHVPVLNPLGYLFGEEDTGNKEDKDDGFLGKVKQWAMRKFGSKSS